MKRLLLSLMVVATAVLSMSLLPVPNVAIGSPKEEEKKIYGETRPDAALVYILWVGPRAPRATRFFCDDQLVGALRHNNYTFAYIASGTHVFWSDFVELGIFDFAAGQTYYLSFAMVDNRSLPSIISEADGQASIKNASQYTEVSHEQRTKAAGTIAKYWPKIKKKLGSQLSPAGGEIVYTPPASTENMVKIPAGTAVMAELMENISSNLNKTNDVVWVRVAEDTQIDGNLFVRAGTPVKAAIRAAKKRGRFAKGGYLDLTIVSVATADGIVCPLLGQVARSGAQGSLVPQYVGVFAASVAGNIAAGSFVKGAQSFIPAGVVVKVFTRQDMWIKPLQAGNEPNSAIVTPPDLVKAYARDKIVCNFRKGKVPQVVEIAFEGVSDISSVELFRAAGGKIPTPVRPSNLSRIKEGWVAQFGGWDLCRFLRLGDVGTELGFRLTASDGTVVIAQATVPMVLE